jgi:hypothetical protein
MGCDIHIVLERRKSGGEWIGAMATDFHPKSRIEVAQRDYDFFAAVANVRGSGGRYPKNVPKDISELAWELYMDAPTDHHSPSWMDAAEFCQIHNAVNPSKSRAEHALFDLFGVWSGEDDVEWRVVFWFDN